MEWVATAALGLGSALVGALGAAWRAGGKASETDGRIARCESTALDAKTLAADHFQAAQLQHSSFISRFAALETHRAVTEVRLDRVVEDLRDVKALCEEIRDRLPPPSRIVKVE